jgi:hypothetical protein
VAAHDSFLTVREVRLAEGLPDNRILTVANDRRIVDLPLTAAGFADLARRELIYLCIDGHDLHLDPERDWNLEDVEAVCLAIAPAAAPGGAEIAPDPKPRKASR